MNPTTYEQIGQPILGQDFAKQKINCRVARKEVVLTARVGIVQCQEWKRCEHHSRDGCPEKGIESLLVWTQDETRMLERVLTGIKKLKVAK